MLCKPFQMFFNSLCAFTQERFMHKKSQNYANRTGRYFFLNFFDKSFCCLNIISYFCDVI